MVLAIRGEQEMAKKQTSTSTAPAGTGWRIKNVKRLLAKRDMTRTDLMYKTKISYKTLIDLEDERLRDSVSAKVIYELMQALDVGFGDLIEFVIDGKAI